MTLKISKKGKEIYTRTPTFGFFFKKTNEKGEKIRMIFSGVVHVGIMGMTR